MNRELVDPVARSRTSSDSSLSDRDAARSHSRSWIYREPETEGVDDSSGRDVYWLRHKWVPRARTTPQPLSTAVSGPAQGNETLAPALLHRYASDQELWKANLVQTDGGDSKFEWETEKFDDLLVQQLDDQTVDTCSYCTILAKRVSHTRCYTLFYLALLALGSFSLALSLETVLNEERPRDRGVSFYLCYGGLLLLFCIELTVRLLASGRRFWTRQLNILDVAMFGLSIIALGLDIYPFDMRTRPAGTSNRTVSIDATIMIADTGVLTLNTLLIFTRVIALGCQHQRYQRRIRDAANQVMIPDDHTSPLLSPRQTPPAPPGAKLPAPACLPGSSNGNGTSLMGRSPVMTLGSMPPPMTFTSFSSNSSSLLDLASGPLGPIDESADDCTLNATAQGSGGVLFSPPPVHYITPSNRPRTLTESSVNEVEDPSRGSTG